jgi:hypothetical protein
MMRARTIWAGPMVAAGLVAAAGAAQADGYPPFYGYSPYFGGPAPYFTPDDTIHEVTTEKGGEYGFGTRTYYRGGPFWTYQATPRRFVRARPTRHASRHVLRRRY